MADILKQKSSPPPTTSTPSAQSSAALNAEVDRLQMRICTLKTENVNMLESQDNEQHKNELLLIETSSLKAQLEKLLGKLSEFAAEQEKYEETILKLQGDVMGLRSAEVVDEEVEGVEGGGKGWFGF
jgi:predicted nuclease with TOPRIM domain